jgi:hypothetical protein
MMTDADDNLSPFEMALAVTELVTDAGYALLPEQPTAAMLEAGVMACDLSMEQVSLVYRAMHRAALAEFGIAAHDPIALMQKLLMSKQAH